MPKDDPDAHLQRLDDELCAALTALDGVDHIVSTPAAASVQLRGGMCAPHPPCEDFPCATHAPFVCAAATILCRS